jgi:hypothetical protein
VPVDGYFACPLGSRCRRWRAFCHKRGLNVVDDGPNFP